MPQDKAPSKDALLALIAEQKGEPDLSRLPYGLQQDITNDPNHPIRREIVRRDRQIRQRLKTLGLERDDVEASELESE